MGCNGSKQEDVAQDRHRNQAQGGAGQRPMPTSGAHVIPGSQVIEREDFGLGKTPSDRHMEEADSFQDLILRTQANFIDVSFNSVAPLEGKDAIDRARDYTVQLERSSVPDQSLGLYSIPAGTADGAQAALSGEAVTSSDVEFMSMLGNNLVGAFKEGLQVKNVGPIVEYLPDVDLTA